MITLSIKKNEKILVLTPHPDDECIGVGGVLLNYPKQCDVWLMTDGSQGRTNKYTKKQISEIRMKEFISEMQHLGVNDYRMFGIEDGTLTQAFDILLKEDISGYNKIFVPNKDDRHIDHRATYIALKNTITNYNLKGIEVYQYEVSAPLPQVTHLIELKNINDKIELISFHKSQTEQYDYCGYAYHLNAFRAITNNARGLFIETYLLSNMFEEKDNSKEENLEKEYQKQMHIIKLYDKWLDLELNNIDIADVLSQQQYNDIVIYGFGKLGKRLYQCLKNSNKVHIKFIIDKMADYIQNDDVQITIPSKQKTTIDVIIVTAIHEFSSIKMELELLGYNNVISFEDLLDMDY